MFAVSIQYGNAPDVVDAGSRGRDVIAIALYTRESLSVFRSDNPNSLPIDYTVIPSHSATNGNFPQLTRPDRVPVQNQRYFIKPTIHPANV